MKNPKSHVTLIAALHIGWGGLTIIGGLIAFFVLNFATGQVEPYDEIGFTVMKWITAFVPIIVFISGGINILAGVALFSYKQWARVIMIIVAAVKCLNIPIGTALGVYSIWALMQQEVSELFE